MRSSQSFPGKGKVEFGPPSGPVSTRGFAYMEGLRKNKGQSSPSEGQSSSSPRSKSLLCCQESPSAEDIRAVIQTDLPVEWHEDGDGKHRTDREELECGSEKVEQLEMVISWSWFIKIKRTTAASRPTI